MSTFPGTFEELKNISVDKFNGENVKSSVFFLSHCHTDHMEGIYPVLDDNFTDKLSKNGIFLYSSPVTTMMLKQWYPKYKDRFVDLSFEKPNQIQVSSQDYEDYSLSVIIIPAGHCPGSVMFLFETDSKRILYTGDFRIKVSDLKKINSFYDNLGKLKKIDRIYMDSTFFSEKFPDFPSREETLKCLINAIEEWVGHSKDHVIHLVAGAVYGPEHLLLEIYKHFKIPIHVREDVYNILKYFPEMDRALTLNSETQIHYGCAGYKEICIKGNNKIKKTIRTTAWVWKNWKCGNPITTKYFDEQRICYSAHASYNELCGFIKFFKPGSIKPNVLPKNKLEAILLQESINKVLCSIEEKPVSDMVDHITFKLSDNENIELNQKPNFNTSCSANDEMRSLLDSPPLKMRKM